MFVGDCLLMGLVKVVEFNFFGCEGLRGRCHDQKFKIPMVSMRNILGFLIFDLDVPMYLLGCYLGRDGDVMTKIWTSLFINVEGWIFWFRIASVFIGWIM